MCACARCAWPTYECRTTTPAPNHPIYSPPHNTHHCTAQDAARLRDQLKELEERLAPAAAAAAEEADGGGSGSGGSGGGAGIATWSDTVTEGIRVRVERCVFLQARARSWGERQP